MLQASRWRVKTANTILQIPWKKVKSYANTPTWSKKSANSQYKVWIWKKYHGYQPIRILHSYIRCSYVRKPYQSSFLIDFVVVLKTCIKTVWVPLITSQQTTSSSFHQYLHNLISFFFRFWFDQIFFRMSEGKQQNK